MNVTPALYGALDLVVIPSRTEGLPNVLLEAIGCGVPVVSTAVGAVPDVLSGSEAGIMVPIEEPNALADAIHRMLDHRQDSAVVRSQEQLKARFSLESRVESHIRLYSGLIHTSI
jgi:glycosyltransferase involved in cell wall biosynthesis